MREYQFRIFKDAVESRILRQANRGMSPEEILDWLLDSLVDSGSDSYTGRQLGELRAMIPGKRYRAAG